MEETRGAIMRNWVLLKLDLTLFPFEGNLLRYVAKETYSQQDPFGLWVLVFVFQTISLLYKHIGYLTKETKNTQVDGVGKSKDTWRSITWGVSSSHTIQWLTCFAYCTRTCAALFPSWWAEILGLFVAFFFLLWWGFLQVGMNKYSILFRVILGFLGCFEVLSYQRP